MCVSILARAFGFLAICAFRMILFVFIFNSAFAADYHRSIVSVYVIKDGSIDIQQIILREKELEAENSKDFVKGNSTARGFGIVNGGGSGR